MHQLPPLCFATILRCLETRQQHFLFAKAEKVFQVISLTIRFINVLSTQFMTSLTNSKQPHRSLASQIACLIIPNNLYQCERMLVHWQSVRFALAGHQHIVPCFNLHTLCLAATAFFYNRYRLIRLMPGRWFLQGEPFTIAAWTAHRPFGFVGVRNELPVQNPCSANARNGD